MKNIYITASKELALRFESCKFIGENTIIQDAKLENCRVENCKILYPLVLSDVSIKNAIIKSRVKKQKKIDENYLITKKYFNYLLNFDKNLFDDIKIGVACKNEYMCNVAKTLFEALHADVEILDNQSFFASEDGRRFFQKHRKDVCFWLDESGQKLWAVNCNGQVLNGDEILYLLAWWLNGQNKLCGQVIGTKLTNIGIENKLRALGIALKRVEEDEFLSTVAQTNVVLGATQSGDIAINLDGVAHGALFAMRALASIYLENKNIWLRVKENKYVQVLKTILLEVAPEDIGQVMQTFVGFYGLKVRNQGRVEIWQKDNKLHIMVETTERTMSAVLALDIKKKILKYIKK